MTESDPRHLLPWYVNGTLDQSEQEHVQSWLRDHPEEQHQVSWNVALRSQLDDQAQEVPADIGLARTLAEIEARTGPSPLREPATPPPAPGGWLRSHPQPGARRSGPRLLALAAGIALVIGATVLNLPRRELAKPAGTTEASLRKDQTARLQDDNTPLPKAPEPVPPAATAVPGPLDSGPPRIAREVAPVSRSAPDADSARSAPRRLEHSPATAVATDGNPVIAAAPAEPATAPATPADTPALPSEQSTRAAASAGKQDQASEEHRDDPALPGLAPAPPAMAATAPSDVTTPKPATGSHPGLALRANGVAICPSAATFRNDARIAAATSGESRGPDAWRAYIRTLEKAGCGAAAAREWKEYRQQYPADAVPGP